MKQKSADYKARQDDKNAQRKGFSDAKAYSFYSKTAETEGKELGKSKLRKKELKRIKQEAEQDIIMGRSGKYHKVQKKVQKGFESFQKGAGVYNEVMGELQAFGSGGDMYPVKQSKQAYSSGYGIRKPTRRKTTQKKNKKNKQKKNKKPNDFWSQFY